MKPAEGALSAEANYSEAQAFDLGFFVFLTFLFVLVGRALGIWIGRENWRIQKGPEEFVSRAEEYQKLHNQVGPNAFFRMY